MLKQRVITAVLLALLVVWALFTWPAPYFGVFLLVASAACAWEWSRLGRLNAPQTRAGYTAAATALAAALLLAPAALKVVVPLALLIWLYIVVDLKRRPVKQTPPDQADWPLLALAAFLLATAVASLYVALVERSAFYVVYIVAVVTAADIGAYFAGRRFGRRKLAVEISQGKTIEGAIGGMAAAMLLTIIVLFFFVDSLSVDRTAFFIVSVLAALLSVAGDLFISRAKRTVGVKDSGTLLPGHGGVLDRFDGLLAGAPWLVVPIIWAF